MAAETLLTGSLSFEAASDLSSNQFHFVSVDGSGQIALTGAGLDADGVLQDAPDAAGKIGAVMPLNGSILKVKAGATVTLGGPAMSDATGRAINATATNKVLGTFTKAGAVDEIVEVLAQNRGTF